MKLTKITLYSGEPPLPWFLEKNREDREKEKDKETPVEKIENPTVKTAVETTVNQMNELNKLDNSPYDFSD